LLIGERSLEPPISNLADKLEGKLLKGRNSASYSFYLTQPCRELMFHLCGSIFYISGLSRIAPVTDKGWKANLLVFFKWLL
jgi:hypothetical protein